MSEDTTVGTAFSYAGFDFNLAHTQDNYDASSSETLGNPFDDENTPVENVDGQYNNQERRSLDRDVNELNIHKTVGNRFDFTVHLKDTSGNGSFSTNGYIKSEIGSHGAYDSSTVDEANIDYDVDGDGTIQSDEEGIDYDVDGDGNITDSVDFIGNDIDGDGTIQDDEKFFQQAKSAYGSTNSDSFVGSIDATYLINNDTYLHSGYKKVENENTMNVYAFGDDGNPWQSARFELDENGNTVAILDETNPQSLTTYNFHNYKDKYYVNGEHYFNDNLKMDLGYLYNEEEDAGPHGPGVIEEDGYQLGFLYNPLETVTFNVDYENISDKDSEATEEDVDVNVSWDATDYLTLSGKYKKETKEDIGGAYLGGWAADVGLSTRHLEAKKENESQTLSVAYQPLANLSLDFSYGNNTYETENQFIDYEDPDGYDPLPAEKELVEYTTTMENDMYNVNLNYQANDLFNIGLRGNYVDGTETFSTTDEEFDNMYSDFGLKLTHALPSYENVNVVLDARRVEYDEEESTIGAYGTDANDYDADVITLGLEGSF
ncbi:hypothetical protein SAMN02745118_02260 [Selenihalanaerobacter shriftii]|uniref:Uncharacterized protein n=1 Tax=Selenihalanaerobacter shriftii TaxID=142842 RepID=A0A1T4PNZ5_9FIRM|nr:hypothetical protein SAMN02745118_02260 [Selenihalanaerobacter shriftii]